MPDSRPRPALEDLTARGEAQAALHARARAATRERFGDTVFVRGVVEVSNFCREDCTYCGMRRSNRGLERYRADRRQLEDWLLRHRPAMVTDLNFQAGEDPRVVREVVVPLLETLRRETDLGLSVGLGTLDPALYRELRAAGAAVYILKFETADPAHYATLRAPGTLAERLDHLRRLAAQGWWVSSGFIAGLPGETSAQLLGNFALADSLPLCGCSVSPFVPGEDTPLRDAPAGDVDRTLNCIAALRLLRPDWIIPAVSALNLHAGANGGEGYRRALRAGANLVTLNLTPPRWREDYPIYTRRRYIVSEAYVRETLAAEGLRPAPRGLVAHLESARRAPAPVNGVESSRLQAGQAGGLHHTVGVQPSRLQPEAQPSGNASRSAAPPSRSRQPSRGRPAAAPAAAQRGPSQSRRPEETGPHC